MRAARKWIGCRRAGRLILIVPAAILLGAATATEPASAKKDEYKVTRTLEVSGDGLWTSIALDADGKTMYVPRLRRTMVVDVPSGKVKAEVLGGWGASAVLLSPETGRGFVSNSKDGTITVFDLKSSTALGKIAVGDDPGNMIYDTVSKRVLVCCGLGKSLVPFSPDIDLKTGKVDAAIPLGGRVNSVVADGQGMAYATVKDRDEVAVVDTRTMKEIMTWPVDAWYRPGGIAMDRVRSRLFIGCRSHVVVLSATDGHELADVPMTTIADGVAFCDGKAFAAGMDGTLSVIGQAPDGTFEVQQTIQMLIGAKSLALDEKNGIIYMPGIEANSKKAALGTFKVVAVEKK